MFEDSMGYSSNKIHIFFNLIKNIYYKENGLEKIDYGY